MRTGHTAQVERRGDEGAAEAEEEARDFVEVKRRHRRWPQLLHHPSVFGRVTGRQQERVRPKGERSEWRKHSTGARVRATSASELGAHRGSAGGRMSDTAGEEVERMKGARGRGPAGSRGTIDGDYAASAQHHFVHACPCVRMRWICLLYGVCAVGKHLTAWRDGGEGRDARRRRRGGARASDGGGGGNGGAGGIEAQRRCRIGWRGRERRGRL